jgi:hypothetical protein
LWHWLFCIYFVYGIYVNLISKHTYSVSIFYMVSIFYFQFGFKIRCDNPFNNHMNAMINILVTFNHFNNTPCLSIKLWHYCACKLLQVYTAISHIRHNMFTTNTRVQINQLAENMDWKVAGSSLGSSRNVLGSRLASMILDVPAVRSKPSFRLLFNELPSHLRHLLV